MRDRIKLKAQIDNIFGICCYHLFPLKQEYYIGKGKTIAICNFIKFGFTQRYQK